MDPSTSPCGWAFTSGHQSCNGDTFKAFYEAEITSQCEQKVQDITVGGSDEAAASPTAALSPSLSSSTLSPQPPPASSSPTSSPSPSPSPIPFSVSSPSPSPSSSGPPGSPSEPYADEYYANDYVGDNLIPQIEPGNPSSSSVAPGPSPPAALPSSPAGPPTAGLEDCKGYGRVAAAQGVQLACAAAMRHCESSSSQFMAAAAEAPPDTQVSLNQCEKIAYGVCQSTAVEAASSPCGKTFRGGYIGCTGEEFLQKYDEEISSMCETKVQELAP